MFMRIHLRSHCRSARPQCANHPSASRRFTEKCTALRGRTSAYLSRLWRADERTRTAYPCSLRVMHQALQEFARACKSRIFKGFPFPWLAARCTVLRSRWYQSGINSIVVPT